MAAGPEETKNLAGEILRLIQIRLATLILEESRLLVKLDRCDFEPLRPVPKTQSEFHLRPNKAFSVVAVCISNEMPRDP